MLKTIISDLPHGPSHDCIASEPVSIVPKTVGNHVPFQLRRARDFCYFREDMLHLRNLEGRLWHSTNKRKMVV